MVELPFFETDDEPRKGSEMLDHLEHRLPRLFADARRLSSAGWDVTLTGSGLRVSPKASEVPDGDPADTLPPLLDSLGVESSHRLPTPKTMSEIEAEEAFCRDRVRHGEALVNLSEQDAYAYSLSYDGEYGGWPIPPNSVEEWESVVERIIAKHGEEALAINGSDEWRGLIHRLNTLRWVMGLAPDIC